MRWDPAEVRVDLNVEVRDEEGIEEPVAGRPSQSALRIACGQQSHLQEAPDCGEHVSRILPPAKVDGGPQGHVARQRQARADGEAGYGEACHDYKRDDAYGPPKPDGGDELLQYDREDHAATGASSRREPDR